MPLLHAESHPDHTVIITVSGAVAHHNPEQIHGAVRAAIVRWAPRAVHLDVAGVSLLETATVAALLASHQTGEWAGIPVTLINVGVFPLSQLRDRGLVRILCPHLSAADDGEVVAGHAPGPPAGLLAVKGGAAGSRG